MATSLPFTFIIIRILPSLFLFPPLNSRVPPLFIKYFLHCQQLPPGRGRREHSLLVARAKIILLYLGLWTAHPTQAIILSQHLAGPGPTPLFAMAIRLLCSRSYAFPPSPPQVQQLLRFVWLSSAHKNCPPPSLSFSSLSSHFQLFTLSISP